MSPFLEPEPWVPASPRISPTRRFRPCCSISFFPAEPSRSGRPQRRRGRSKEPSRARSSFPSPRSLITTGNFDDDLAKIKDCDWIIEAVTENLAIKRALYDRVIAHRAPGTIVSTNTSGIPLAQIAEGYPAEFREHFLGTHFFNPPRYLHLVEVIPGPDTRPDILAFISDFCDRHLGKGVVPCKDTPNFIANRIGAFFGSTVQRLTVEHDLTIEEVDALTGPLIGLPKSASYRLLDIVGLDVWEHVTKNLYEAVPQRSVPRTLPDRPVRGRDDSARMARRQDAARASTSASAKTVKSTPSTARRSNTIPPQSPASLRSKPCAKSSRSPIA